MGFPAEDLTLDHVQPKMRGGDDSEGNLVACCVRCNAVKGGLAAWDFLAQRPDLRNNFMSAAETADVRHAQPIWPRLLRAIREAADRQRNTKGALELSDREDTIPPGDGAPPQP
jgi:hypothetical protein